MPSAQFSSVAQSCLTLCDPMDCSTPGLPVHYQLTELTQTHVHWVGDAIQPSHPLSSPFLPAFGLSQHQGLFQWVSSSQQVAKELEFQLQHQYFQWLDRLAVQGTLKSLLQHHSLKASILQHSALFIIQLSHPYMTTGKTIALTRWTFVGKAMPVLFKMLSRLLITFLPRSKRLLIHGCTHHLQWFWSPKNWCLTVSIVSSPICNDVMGPDAMILVFWMLSFKPTFSVSSRGFLVPLHFLP